MGSRYFYFNIRKYKILKDEKIVTKKAVKIIFYDKDTGEKREGMLLRCENRTTEYLNEWNFTIYYNNEIKIVDSYSVEKIYNSHIKKFLIGRKGFSNEIDITFVGGWMRHLNNRSAE